MAGKARGILRARRAPPEMVDDALQAAAEKALRRGGGFDSLAGWVNWTVKVAWHELEAEWHRRARSVPTEAFDQRTDLDPARVVEARIELERTRQGLAALGEADRQAILSALDDDNPAVGTALPASVKMRRSRARRRLSELLAERPSGR